MADSFDPSGVSISAGSWRRWAGLGALGAESAVFVLRCLHFLFFFQKIFLIDLLLFIFIIIIYYYYYVFVVLL